MKLYCTFVFFFLFIFEAKIWLSESMNSAVFFFLNDGSINASFDILLFILAVVYVNIKRSRLRRRKRAKPPPSPLKSQHSALKQSQWKTHLRRRPRTKLCKWRGKNRFVVRWPMVCGWRLSLWLPSFAFLFWFGFFADLWIERTSSLIFSSFLFFWSQIPLGHERRPGDGSPEQAIHHGSCREGSEAGKDHDIWCYDDDRWV